MLGLACLFEVLAGCIFLLSSRHGLAIPGGDWLLTSTFVTAFWGRVQPSGEDPQLRGVITCLIWV